MNVLLVGMSNRNFLVDLQNNLPKSEIKADLLDLLEGYFIRSDGNKMVYGRKIVSKNFFKKNILLYLNFYNIFKFFRNNHTHYDVCNIHFTDVRYFFFKRKLFKIADKLVVTTYGSDYYIYRKYAFLQKPFYKKASRITFANDKTRASFDEYYKQKFSDKLSICRFGLSLLPIIMEVQTNSDYKKNALNDFGFPDDKLIVTIGYNSSPNNQQLKIIDEIIKLDTVYKNRLFLVFPMTYGGFTNYIMEVESLMKKTSIPYCILCDYLSIEKLASLRIASDVMLHLPISDQLSATLCEYLYTANWVITGKWLPYEPIDETGVNYDRINSLSELTAKLTDVLEHYAHHQQLAEQNPGKIWNFSSWSHNINSWIEVYNT